MHFLKRLLVVNPNSEEADELSLLLKLRQPPMYVLTVYSEADALALCRKGYLDVVILCLAPRGLAGAMFARALRLRQVENVPALMVFSKHQGRIAVALQKAFRDNLRVWPDSLDSMASKICRHLVVLDAGSKTCATDCKIRVSCKP